MADDGRQGEAAADDTSCVVSPDLAGPGLIVERATTWWDLRTEAGVAARVHFTEPREARLVDASYASVEIADTHPLLMGLEQPWVSLHVAGAEGALGHRLLGQVAAGIERATGGWRRPEEYLVERGSGAVFREGAGSVLREGHGLLLRAPEAIAAMAARVVQDLGAVPSLMPDRVATATERSGARQRFRALLLGRSFVVARVFAFSRRAGG